MNFNVELFQKIKNHILEEPRRMDMRDWIQIFEEEDHVLGGRVPPCRTAGCISGWAHMLTGSKGYSDTEKACELLGFNHDFEDKVFYSENWPTYFRTKLNKTYSRTPEYAAVVAEFIDWLCDDPSVLSVIMSDWIYLVPNKKVGEAL